MMVAAKQVKIDDTHHVYISCLTYLAAEAEREKNYGIADILRAATIGIKKWSCDPIEFDGEESDKLIDSMMAAFSVLLQYRQMPKDKKKIILDIMNRLSVSALH